MFFGIKNKEVMKSYGGNCYMILLYDILENTIVNESSGLW